MIRKVISDYLSGEAFDDMLATAIRETPPEKGRTLDILGGLLAAWDAYGVHARMSEAQWSVLWHAAGYDSEPEDMHSAG